MRISDHLASRICEFLAGKGYTVPPGADFLLLAGGNSHITWCLQLPGPADDLVVKVAQPDGPLAPYDVAHEARMMEIAHQAGVPSPGSIGAYQDGDLQFLVMHHVRGAAPSLWEVEGWLKGRPDAARLKVGRSLLSVAASLSRVQPPGPFDMAAQYRSYLDRLLENVAISARGVMAMPPVLIRAHEWLVGQLALITAAPPALHHGDFRLGNAVFRGDDIVAMLDWERAMFGHPLHDLGFLGLPGMRNGDLVGGILRQGEIADIWQELTGQPPDFQLVTYFCNMSMFSELCYMVRAMARLAQGQGRLTGLRPLPLIAELSLDLISGIQRWENGDFDF